MADDIRRIRQSNEAAKKRVARVLEREQSPDDSDDGLDRDTLREIVADELGKRPPMDSASLEFDAATKRSILKAPPWVIALAMVVMAGAFVAWLILRK